MTLRLRIRTRWWLLRPCIWALAAARVACIISQHTAMRLLRTATIRCTIITIEPDDTLSA